MMGVIYSQVNNVESTDWINYLNQSYRFAGGKSVSSQQFPIGTRLLCVNDDQQASSTADDMCP